MISANKQQTIKIGHVVNNYSKEVNLHLRFVLCYMVALYTINKLKIIIICVINKSEIIRVTVRLYGSAKNKTDIFISDGL